MSPHDLTIAGFLFTIVLSIGITIGIGVFTFQRRKVVGAQSFAIVLFLEGAMTIGYFFELISPDLAGKMLWDNIQWIPSLFLPLAYYSFARTYTNRKLKHGFRMWLGLSLIPAVTLLLIFTNGFFGLAVNSPKLIPGDPFQEYTYRFGPLLWVSLIYGYIFTVLTIATLANHALQLQGVRRYQTWIMILGMLIPVLGSFAAFLDLPFVPHRDLSPYTFSFANLLIAVGLFRYHLFEIIPFARESVMANMEDGVIILDDKGCLIDINSAARGLLSIQDDPIIGQSITYLLPGLVEQNELERTSQSLHKEIAIKHAGITVDLHLTRLMSKQGGFSGHMLIFRDVTYRKFQEDILRHGQDILENRVLARTIELEAANDRMKTEVEQRRLAEKEKEIQSHEMEILYQLAIELASLPVDADIEAAVTTRLRQMTGAFVVTMSEYNPFKKTLELRRMEADSAALQEARRLLGHSVTELAVPVSDAMYAEMIENMVGYRSSLTDATSGAIPSAAGAMIQKLFNLELFIGLAIQYHGKLMGSVMVFFRRNQPAPSERLMKALANVLSIVYRRKYAEQAHQESENRFHTMANLLPQPIYESNLEGQITYSNRKGFEVFGYSQLDPNTKITDLIVEEQRKQLRNNIQNILEGRDTGPAEYVAIRKDGSTFPVLVYSAPNIQGDQVVGLRGVVIDITERITVEDALRASEEKFRSIIEQMSEGIMLVGEDGLVIEMNRAFEQIYGVTKSGLLGRPFWELTQQLDYADEKISNPVEEAQKDFQTILHNNHQILSEEVEFRIPDGSRRVIQRTAFPVFVSQGERMAVVVSDITERKNAEQEQRRLNRTLTMISECNQALIRMGNEEDLLQEICNIIVNKGDYGYAWIGFIQKGPALTIRPIAASGEAGNLFEVMAACGESPEDACLRNYISADITSLQPLIINDVRVDPNFSIMGNEFVKQGFLSVLIFPLVFGPELYGCLHIYSRESIVPDQNELDLLIEMVNDVSFGIHSIRTHTARERAEQQVYEANKELNQAYESTLEGWSRALELRERETAGHSQRVVALTLAMAKKMGFSEEDLVHIRRGALLHDIGKMGVPDDILLKPGPLNSEEWLIMKQHPQYAYQLLFRIPYLGQAIEIPYGHHERWDGSGYPRQLKGTDIPLISRIFAVVDVWDALTSNRPYRPAWTEEMVISYLNSQAGLLFDPLVVEEFLKLKAHNFIL